MIIRAIDGTMTKFDVHGTFFNKTDITQAMLTAVDESIESAYTSEGERFILCELIGGYALVDYSDGSVVYLSSWSAFKQWMKGLSQ